MRYVLYKNPVQPDTLAVVRYLHSVLPTLAACPAACVERSHPPRVTELPAVHDLDTDEWFVGPARCVEFFEARSGLSDLARLSREFAEAHEGYRIQPTFSPGGAGGASPPADPGQKLDQNRGEPSRQGLAASAEPGRFFFRDEASAGGDASAPKTRPLGQQCQ